MDELQALTAGELGRWVGLRDGTSRLVVEDMLGPPVTDADAPRQLGTWRGSSRRYPGNVEIWFDGDMVMFVQVERPTLSQPLEVLLGPPEATIASGLGPSYEQLVWPARGLAAHRSTVDGEVFRLYGFVPTALDDFLDGALARVSIERRRA